MFDFARTAKYTQILLQNPGEVAAIIANLQKHGIYVSALELMQMGWRDSLKYLIEQFKARYKDKFDAVIESEMSIILRAMQLIKQYGYDDFTPRNIIETLHLNGVNPKPYEQAITEGF